MKSAASTSFRIRRWASDRPPRSTQDPVAVEEPLEIRVDTQSVAVVMRTPGHDDELAAGFLLSEGIVGSRSELRAVRPYTRNRTGNVIDVFLAGHRTLDLEQFTRHVFASSACGLCGRTSIAAVRRRFPPLRETFRVDPDVLRSLPVRLRAAQPGFDATGGLHAAALFSVDGTLRLLREDVGRHNAVDKVLGRCLLDGTLPVQRSVLLVSGRASFEIVQKALAGGVAFVAAVGAPSSLAVAFSRASGQTLVGFLRDGGFNAYAGVRRIGRASLRK